MTVESTDMDMQTTDKSSSFADPEKYKMIAENVTISYDGIEAVKNITMKFKEKSVTALIGPSGCGKTTFLRCLNRMHDMTKNATVTGKVKIDDIDLYDKSIDPIYHRRKVGMVFQKPNPFPTMSIYDNVTAGLKLNGVRDKKILDEIVEDSLKMAYLWDEVKDDLKKSAIELSGGQQQRVFIAKALINQPKVLILDEPVTGIDVASTEIFYSILRDINSKQKITIIWSSHDMDAVDRLANKVACLDRTLFFHGKSKEFFDNEELVKKYSEASMQQHMHDHH